jgi:Asp-tRNA(Asn)/Glu-tRNA(Gln) amidotransferase A subunit family amidase
MPIGLQIVGPQHADVEVLALMRHIEQNQLR